MEIEMAHSETRSPWMTDRASAEAVWFLATRMTVLATAEPTDGPLGLIEVVVPPGFSPPLHVHSREDEPMYVIEGRVTYQVGDRRFEAGPGSFVFLPRGIPHTFVIEGDTPARMLVLCTPGGFERFHLEGGTPAVDESIPVSFDPAQLDVVRALQHKYDEEHVG